MGSRADEVAIKKFLAIKEEFAVDPPLPKNWDCTPNELRPECHNRIKFMPYIQTHRSDDEKFLAHFPDGVRYDVRMYDGWCWDRSTNYGSYATLDGALRKCELIKKTSYDRLPYLTGNDTDE